VGDGRISLAWTMPASGVPTSGYVVSYAAAGGSWSTISLGARTSYTLTGLRNGTSYYVYLYAMSSGARSPAATATALLPNGTPRNYRVTSVGDGRLSFAWTVPASGVPTSGYFVSYAPAGGAWSTISLGARTSYTLTGLRNGTRYYVYLYAISSGGKSPAATASGVPGRRPDAVPLTVSNGNQAVTLRWRAPYNGGYPINGYVVQIGTNGVWRDLVTLPSSASSYTVRNLLNGRSYYFRVAAVNHFGQGASSQPSLARPVAPPPPPPSPGPCDPNYSGCVPIDSDVDCAGGSGNGPSYVVGPVRVIGNDIYDLDSDNDGIGCE
jgi:hypothetical protein